MGGHFNIVELLLKHKADVNLKDKVNVGGLIGKGEKGPVVEVAGIV